jgi:hypothetical protein
MAALPWPTKTQCAEFVEHLCWAHSWYKQLPFVGAQFVVFVSSDAGAGFEERERLHYGWKTTDEYRRLFGMLDYAWQWSGTTGWARDAGSDIEPSRELLAIAGFSLGPTCSNDFNAIDVICARYTSEPGDADGISLLCELHRRAEEAFQALGELDRDAAVRDDLAASVTPSVRTYRELAARVGDHYESLRAPQVAAIAQAIERLAAALATQV